MHVGQMTKMHNLFHFQCHDGVYMSPRTVCGYQCFGVSISFFEKNLELQLQNISKAPVMEVLLVSRFTKVARQRAPAKIPVVNETVSVGGQCKICGRYFHIERGQGSLMARQWC